MSTINNPAGLTHEQILELKEQGTGTPSSSFAAPINREKAPSISERSQKVSRPNIAGSGNYVTRVDVSRHLEAHEASQRELDKAAKEYVSPEQALNDQIQYLTRAVKKLQKEVNSLKAQSTHES